MKPKLFSTHWYYHALFRQRPDGDWDFCPYGRWGRGYRVSTIQRGELVDSMFRHDLGIIVCVMLILVLGLLAVATTGWDASGVTDAIELVLFPGLIGLIVLLRFRHLRRLTTGLPELEARPTRRELYQSYALNAPRPLLLIMLGLGPIGFVASVGGLFKAIGARDWASAILQAFIAALCAFAVWYYFQIWKNRPRG